MSGREEPGTARHEAYEQALAAAKERRRLLADIDTTAPAKARRVGVPVPRMDPIDAERNAHVDEVR